VNGSDAKGLKRLKSIRGLKGVSEKVFSHPCSRLLTQPVNLADKNRQFTLHDLPNNFQVTARNFEGFKIMLEELREFLAVKICGELGITLIGYVRGTAFDVYCCPEKLSRAQAD
jgi:hypothetical protein